MARHQIVFIQRGENSTTPRDPFAVLLYQEGTKLVVRDGRIGHETSVDLNETVTVCFSSDNDLLVKKNRFEVLEIEIPDWMTPDEWIRDSVGWKYTWEAGVDPKWPEEWQRGLHRFRETSKRMACVQLLTTKNFRSDFRRSLRDQLVDWLETAVEFRQYDEPFSRKQWAALIDLRMERQAKNMDTRLYYHARGADGAPRPAGVAP